jgi:hypothetical protein
MAIQGCVIGDSLRPDAELRPDGWRVTRIWRIDWADRAGPEQPSEWTVFDFEAEDDQAETLAEALARALKPKGGWYADFRVGDDHVVVFAGQTFRYRRGDASGRAQAIRYGLSVGVPRHQLDWAD